MAKTSKAKKKSMKKKAAPARKKEDVEICECWRGMPAFQTHYFRKSTVRGNRPPATCSTATCIRMNIALNYEDKTESKNSQIFIYSSTVRGR